MSGMEDKLRQSHAERMDFQTQLQVAQRNQHAVEDTNQLMTIDLENARKKVSTLQSKLSTLEQERQVLEAEARDTGDQLMKMSEKVFQLLERMKLAELGKNKAIETLKRKEQEVIALKKKNSRLLHENTREGKARVKAELDKKVIYDQLEAVKKHTSQLNHRCREEVKEKLRELEDKKVALEKVQTLGGRLTFVLNKMQTEEELKIQMKEELKKLSAQVLSFTERNAELETKASTATESNRVVTSALRLKQREVEELLGQNQVLVEQAQAQAVAQAVGPLSPTNGPTSDSTTTTNNKEGHNSTANSYYYVETKPNSGLLHLKVRPQVPQVDQASACLDRYQIPAFLKRVQKESQSKNYLVQKIGQLLTYLVQEQQRLSSLKDTRDSIQETVHHLGQKNLFLTEKLGSEEDAKRRTLLRYVHAVKSTTNSNSPNAQDNIRRLQLPESGIGDEEVHAIAALLREDASTSSSSGAIEQLNLKSNKISDEGARAIAAVLSSSRSIQQIDLRNNLISKKGIECLAEALERNPRSKHVYVHAGGKIEALGTSMNNNNNNPSTMMNVETICVVDLRENHPPTKASGLESSSSSSSTMVKQQPSSTKPIRSAKVQQLPTTTASPTPGMKKKMLKTPKSPTVSTKTPKKKATHPGERNWVGQSGGMTTKSEDVLPSLMPTSPSNSSSNSAKAEGLTRSTSASAIEKDSFVQRLHNSPLTSNPNPKGDKS